MRTSVAACSAAARPPTAGPVSSTRTRSSDWPGGGGRGGPSGSTTTLVYDFYLRAFGNGLADYGRASAIAMILLLLVILMTAFQFGVLERRVHYR